MKAAALLLVAVTLAGCDQSMTDQKRFDTMSASDLWADGKAARPRPAGTVARGDLAREAAATTPPAVTRALLDRGQERYDIFCAPCHGLTGAGDGVIVQRGFPRPKPFHAPDQIALTAPHLVEVITNGLGVMYGFGARVPAADRWAIVAYVRALQLADPDSPAVVKASAP